MDKINKGKKHKIYYYLSSMLRRFMPNIILSIKPIRLIQEIYGPYFKGEKSWGNDPRFI